LYDLI